MWLKHESGEATELRNSQVLGDDSPLEFDEDGYAEVDDERGRKLLTMHRHIERGGHGPPGSGDDAYGDAADVDDLDGESATLPFNPEAKTIAEIEDEIADIDDAAAVRALKNLEAEQQDRSGAEDVFDDRLAELADEEE